MGYWFGIWDYTIFVPVPLPLSQPYLTLLFYKEVWYSFLGLNSWSYRLQSKCWCFSRIKSSLNNNPGYCLYIPSLIGSIIVNRSIQLLSNKFIQTNKLTDISNIGRIYIVYQDLWSGVIRVMKILVKIINIVNGYYNHWAFYCFRWVREFRLF